MQTDIDKIQLKSINLSAEFVRKIKTLAKENHKNNPEASLSKELLSSFEEIEKILFSSIYKIFLSDVDMTIESKEECIKQTFKDLIIDDEFWLAFNNKVKILRKEQADAIRKNYESKIEELKKPNKKLYFSAISKDVDSLEILMKTERLNKKAGVEIEGIHVELGIEDCFGIFEDMATGIISKSVKKIDRIVKYTKNANNLGIDIDIATKIKEDRIERESKNDNNTLKLNT